MKLSLFNIHDVVVMITLALCLLLGTFQFFAPNKNNLAKYFLALLLLDIALGGLAVLVFWNPFIKIQPFFDLYIIPYVLIASLMLKGPILYGYVSSITIKSFRLRIYDAVHLLPLLFCFAVMLVCGLTSENLRFHNPTKFLRDMSQYEWHAVKISPVIYAMLAVYKVQRYRKHLKDQYSSLSPQGPAWLNILTLGVLFNWGWSLGVHYLGNSMGAQFTDKFGIADNYLTLLLIFSLFAYSLIYANKLLSANFDSSPVIAVSDTKNSIIEKINYCMAVEKLFLNPRLNIERLSEHINVPYREVSATLNNHFKTNFFEYINQQRIDEAKKLLADARLVDMSIQEVFTQAGFNSKSAFHRFFNRWVGMSPTEFRKQALAQTLK
jgi:AraC-like DNA-binding protein